MDLTYNLVGAVTIISEEAAKALGYDKKDYVQFGMSYLVYSKNDVLSEGILFIETNNKKKYIHDHLIKEYYKIDDARYKFPELFL